MPIEYLSKNDAFDRFKGFYIRVTDIKSKALAIVQTGGKPETIATLDEHHYAIYHKEPHAKSTCEAVYDTLEDAEAALKEFNSGE